mgnify:CR=1 FL=1
MKEKVLTKWNLPLDLVELHDEEIALIKGGGMEVSEINNGCNPGCNPGCSVTKPITPTTPTNAV